MSMASITSLSFVSLLLLVVFIPIIALGNDIWPPFYEKVCDEVQCGKGKCVANSSFPFNYSCECDDGWKRTVDDDDDLTFLPCVIPKCTLNYASCQPAPPPVPEKEVPHNISAFDPCYWIYCGEGTCTKNQTYTHTCTCKSGYFNLLNVSYYPCYSQCTIGSDCANLGIKVLNSETSTTTSTPGTAADGSSHGNSILPGKFNWMIMLLVPLVRAIWM